jgi:hypothetical protein
MQNKDGVLWARLDPKKVGKEESKKEREGDRRNKRRNQRRIVHYWGV